MRRAWMVSVLVGFVFLLGSTAPRSAEAKPRLHEYGELRHTTAKAPNGTWTCRRGNAAGTRCTTTRPTVGELETRWTFEVKGINKGNVCWPPLVWGRRVWVTIHGKKDRYSIHTLSLHDGKPIAPPLVIMSKTHPQPSLWNSRLLVRQGKQELRIYDFLRGKMRPTWRIQSKHIFQNPILHERRVYVQEDGHLAEYWLPNHRAKWKSPWRTYGEFSIRDGHAYAMHYTGDGRCYIVDGPHPRLGVLVALTPNSKAAGGVNKSEVVALRDCVICRHGDSIFRRSDGTKVNAAVVSRSSSLWGREEVLQPVEKITQFDGRILVGIKGAVAELPGRAVCTMARGADTFVAHSAPEHDGLPFQRYYAITEAARYRSVVADPRYISVAQDVVYVGNIAYDSRTLDVVWKGDFDVAFAPVPAPDHLLVVDTNRVLHALADPDVAARRGVVFTSSTEPVTADKGEIVLPTGRSMKRKFTFDPKTMSLVVDKGPAGTETLTRDDVRLVYDQDGKVIFAESVGDIAIAMDEQLELGQKSAYAALAKQAYKANDARFLEFLFNECERIGATDRNLRVIRQMLEGLERREPKIKEKEQARAFKNYGELRRKRVAKVSKALAELLGDGSRREQLMALTQLLKVDPESVTGRDALMKRLPPFLTPPSGYDVHEWAALALAASGRPLTQVTSAQGKDASPAQRLLAKLETTWRPDVLGISSGRIMIASPLDQPAAIAKCLVLGELVCEALEGVFGVKPEDAAKLPPMPIQLFEDRDEYVKVLGGGKLLERSAGVFNPVTGITSVYLPDSDGAWESVMETCAHELAHQWLELRCPMEKRAVAEERYTQPGFWIVEGMADLLKEFRWDPALRTWNSRNPRAFSLDFAAHGSPTSMLGWSRLYGMSQKDWQALEGKKAVEFEPRWRLGLPVLVNAPKLLYLQGAATCHYLYNAGPEMRAALREFVKAYYGGKLGKDDGIQKYFKMSPAQLGQRVQAYADKVSK